MWAKTVNTGNCIKTSKCPNVDLPNITVDRLIRMISPANNRIIPVILWEMNENMPSLKFIL